MMMTTVIQREEPHVMSEWWQHLRERLLLRKVIPIPHPPDTTVGTKNPRRQLFRSVYFASRIIRLLFLIVLLQYLVNTGTTHRLSLRSVVSGKEIVAQRDTWTLIGENDTVDAGMHIRIDMTTGEKWVKQLTDDDDGNDTTEHSKTTDSKQQQQQQHRTVSPPESSTAVVVVVAESESGNSDNTVQTNSQREQTELTMNGEDSTGNRDTKILPLPKQIIYNDNTTTTTTSSSSDTTQPPKNTMESPKYDYDMMYRTLRKLPMEEQIRMQLPTEYVPDTATTTMEELSSTQSSNSTAMKQQQRRHEFETQLRYIWEQRQKELLEFEVADLPQILKQYISDMRQYITLSSSPPHSPSKLVSSDTTDPTNGNTTHHSAAAADNSNKNNKNTTDDEISHRHMISILQELEYQLQDIDLTRDFHTLQGWNLLVSLLSSTNVSFSRTTQNNNSHTHTSHHTSMDSIVTTNTRQYQEQHEVQMYTAWVIGTALKHIPEFHTYAIEPIRVVVPSINTTTTTTTITTTTLDLVLEQIRTSYMEYVHWVTTHSGNSSPQQETNTEDIDVILKLLQTKLLRLVYCLGSLLRGNYHAQQHILLSNAISHHQQTSATVEDELSVNALQQLMNNVIVPSLHQIHHHELVISLTTTNTSSSRSSDNSTAITTFPELQQQHIDFVYKFIQRSLNVISDCLMEIQSNVNDDNDNPKWNLQHTNPTQYQQLQTIYALWQGTLCKTASVAESKATPLTAEERLLRYHRSDNDTILDLKSFLSSPISSTNHQYKIEELQSTIGVILDHCP